MCTFCFYKSAMEIISNFVDIKKRQHVFCITYLNLKMIPRFIFVSSLRLVYCWTVREVRLTIHILYAWCHFTTLQFVFFMKPATLKIRTKVIIFTKNKSYSSYDDRWFNFFKCHLSTRPGVGNSFWLAGHIGDRFGLRGQL